MGQAEKIDACVGEVNEEEVSRLLSDLVRIDSTNPDNTEMEVAELVSDHLKESGCEVEFQEVLSGRPNVIGRLTGSKGSPRLAFNTHMDVVPGGKGLDRGTFRRRDSGRKGIRKGGDGRERLSRQHASRHPGHLALRGEAPG